MALLFFTCPVTLTGLFYFFGNSEDSLGRCGSVYTPPPGSVPGDADRATLCPMGSRCPGLNAVFRMPSAVAKENFYAFLRHIAQLFTFPHVCIMSTP